MSYLVGNLENRFSSDKPPIFLQFSGDSAAQMKYSYGVFCSGHLEAVQSYKEQVIRHREFHSFIKVIKKCFFLLEHHVAKSTVLNVYEGSDQPAPHLSELVPIITECNVG